MPPALYRLSGFGVVLHLPEHHRDLFPWHPISLLHVTPPAIRLKHDSPRPVPRNNSYRSLSHP